mmetsp:Transcript_5320/g.11550  ORF Transcript_5320/g.11550 Transcript_5320/m.11550 type:complete len:88 (-) Transcript_5320:31-294(-)
MMMILYPFSSMVGSVAYAPRKAMRILSYTESESMSNLMRLGLFLTDGFANSRLWSGALTKKTHKSSLETEKRIDCGITFLCECTSSY